MNLKKTIKLIPKFLIKFWMPILGIFLVSLIFSLGYMGEGLVETGNSQVKAEEIEVIDNEESEQELEIKDEVEQKDYSNYKFLKNLIPGCEGEDVLALQYKLGIEMTGIYDDDTFAAVSSYQVKNKILPSGKADGAGYFGPKTRSFMNTGELADTDKNDSSAPPEFNNNPPLDNPAPEVKHYVNLSITSGSAVGSYQVEIQGNETVFSILLKASEQNSFDLDYTNYGGDMGIFVEKIGNLENSDDWSSFWQYWINGQYATVGCSVQSVKEGDTIEWRCASSPW